MAQRSTFDFEAKRAQARELELEAAKPDIWDDPAAARRLTTRLSRLNDAIRRYDRLLEQLDDVKVTDELLGMEDDARLARELPQKLAALEAELDRVELANLLAEESDASDAVGTVHGGA